MADPKFVRLHNRLANGSHTDLASGFGISGLDIKLFPGDEDPRAQEHVRDGMRRGIYEEADQQEVDAFHDVKADYLARTGVEVRPHELQSTFQEGQVQAHAAADRAGVSASRGLGPVGGKVREEADQKRRDALLAAQKGSEEAPPPQGATEASSGAPAASSEQPTPEQEAAARAQAEVDAAAAKSSGKQKP